jgi:hypothetical protein
MVRRKKEILIMNLKKKWIEILYNVATGSKKIRNLFTPIGALIYGLLIFSFVVILNIGKGHLCFSRVWGYYSREENDNKIKKEKIEMKPNELPPPKIERSNLCSKN